MGSSYTRSSRRSVQPRRCVTCSLMPPLCYGPETVGVSRGPSLPSIGYQLLVRYDAVRLARPPPVIGSLEEIPYCISRSDSAARTQYLVCAFGLGALPFARSLPRGGSDEQHGA